jgi:uncharacterized protein (DUF2252 family)
MMTNLLSQEERLAQGQSNRKKMPRQELGKWAAKNRRQSPLKLMEESMRGRVSSLVSLKYERMLESPFGFFRGAVPVMAADLASAPNTGICNQICGDAHVRNLGAFAAPDGRLVFDINDFDETIQGPFEWDVKRLATSLVLAGREVGDKDSLCEEAVTKFLSSYNKLINLFAKMPIVEMVHYQIHRLQHVNPISQVLFKAERATPQHVQEQLTESVKSAKARRFKETKPILTRLSAAEAKPVLASLREYAENLQPERRYFLSRYRPIDVAFKVVGTGSVGLRDYVIYFEGNGPTDPLFLQIKEEPGSAYAPYLKTSDKKRHHGRQVVNGQRAMQFQTDPFLGWTTIDKRDYLVRQLNDHKASIEVTDLKGEGLLDYAEVCGELFARGHARSGDACLIAGYMGNAGKFDKSISQFAFAYANQTTSDWEELKKNRQAPKAPKAPKTSKTKS